MVLWDWQCTVIKKTHHIFAELIIHKLWTINSLCCSSPLSCYKSLQLPALYPSDSEVRTFTDFTLQNGSHIPITLRGRNTHKLKNCTSLVNSHSPASTSRDSSPSSQALGTVLKWYWWISRAHPASNEAETTQQSPYANEKNPREHTIELEVSTAPIRDCKLCSTISQMKTFGTFSQAICTFAIILGNCSPLP